MAGSVAVGADILGGSAAADAAASAAVDAVATDAATSAATDVASSALDSAPIDASAPPDVSSPSPLDSAPSAPSPAPEPPPETPPTDTPPTDTSAPETTSPTDSAPSPDSTPSTPSTPSSSPLQNLQTAKSALGMAQTLLGGPTALKPTSALPSASALPSSPATQPTETGSSGSMPSESFIPVTNPWLSVKGPSQSYGYKQESLPELYSSITSEPRPEIPGLEQSFQNINPELLSLMQSRMGMAEGGDVASSIQQYGSDPQKLISSMAPSFVKSEPKFLRPQGKTSPAQMAGLTQIKQAPKLGAFAGGGLPSKYEENAPKGHKPEFITGLTGYYAGGRGTGQSDDIPAMLHQGDYVIDAEAVSAFGDGSSKAGKEVLSHFLHKVPHKDHAEGEPVPAKIADGEFVLPESFVTALGKGDNKRGAEMLDQMRKNLREHKRSAPLSKIPPKAKSPLDYLKGVKG